MKTPCLPNIAAPPIRETDPDSAAALARLEVEAFYGLLCTVTVTYRGHSADLVAAGVATPDMLAPAQPGRRRRTVAGTHYRRTPPDRKGRQEIRFHGLPIEVAESMSGVSRTWRSTVWPLLELSDDQCQAFGAEGGLYREAGAY